MPEPGARPLRSDARTNRARILDAATRVFGAGGESASTEEVARLAGVGIATVFRHFPTKAALLEAVLAARLTELRDEARRLAAAADPGQALREYFAYSVREAAAKLAIAGALTAEARDAGAGPDPDSGGPAARASAELESAVAALLDRARQAGAVRADVAFPEFYALLIGACRATAYDGLDDRVRDRVTAIIFDGLVPRGHPAL